MKRVTEKIILNNFLEKSYVKKDCGDGMPSPQSYQI